MRTDRGPNRPVHPWVQAVHEYAQRRPDYVQACQEYVRTHEHEHVDCPHSGCFGCCAPTVNEQL